MNFKAHYYKAQCLWAQYSNVILSHLILQKFAKHKILKRGCLFGTNLEAGTLSIDYMYFFFELTFFHFLTRCPSGFILSATARGNAGY